MSESEWRGRKSSRLRSECVACAPISLIFTGSKSHFLPRAIAKRVVAPPPASSGSAQSKVSKTPAAKKNTQKSLLKGIVVKKKDKGKAKDVNSPGVSSKTEGTTDGKGKKRTASSEAPQSSEKTHPAEDAGSGPDGSKRPRIDN